MLCMLLACTLTVGVLLVVVWTDTGWSGPLIAASLVVCLGMMVNLGVLTRRSV
jgi:hypothetical protein